MIYLRRPKDSTTNMSFKMMIKLMFVAVIFTLNYTVAGSAAIINVPPVDTIGCYGGISKFFCKSNLGDVVVNWNINDDGITEQDKETRGITINNDNSLSIMGLPINNNISIGCSILVSTPPYSETSSATFTVTDPSPIHNLTIQFNNDIMTCTWSQPSCVPVNYGYHVNINNESLMVTNTTTIQYPVASCQSYTVSVTVMDTTQPQYHSETITKETNETDYIGDIRYNVTMIGVEVLLDEFCARFLLEMYSKCSLSQPNYVIISSNTSDSKQYTITGTTFGNTLEIKHKIYPYIKHHSFTIEDSSGKIITRTTNKSSFNIQEFNLKELPGSLVATFGFTPGSTLTELILNITGNKNTKINVTRPSGSDSLIVTKKISPFPAGMYDIQVIEGGNKTVFDTHVSIPSPSVSISVTTLTINATVTESVKESLETNKNHESAVIGLVIVLVIILVGASIIIAGLVIYILYSVKKSSTYYMCPEDNLLVAVQIIRNELFPDNRNHGLDGQNDHSQTPPDNVNNNPLESTGNITSDMMVASVQPPPSMNSDQVRFSSLNNIAEDSTGVQVDTGGKSKTHIPLPPLIPDEVRIQQSEQNQHAHSSSISSQLKFNVDSKSTSLVDKSIPLLEGQDESKEPSQQMDDYINEPPYRSSIDNSKGITSTSNPSECTEGSHLLQ